MGGADVFCSICGGPLNPPWWETEDEDDNQSRASGAEEVKEEENDNRNEASEEEEFREYDPKVVKPEDEVMNWLSDVRLIGENPASQNPVKTYISGLAVHDDHGRFYDVEPGDDPNFPLVEDNMTTYSWIDAITMTMPFHVACCHLVSKAVGVESLDKQLLYETLKSLAAPGEMEKALDINYGTVRDFHDQYWVCRRGYEHVLFNPADIPRLSDYYTKLHKSSSLATNVDENKTPLSRKLHDSDPFGHLPPEALFLILEYLSIDETLRLRLASSAVDNLELHNSFWRIRLNKDMPWLYEVSAPASERLGESVDWKQVYKDLHVASKQKSKRDAEWIPGLANRRRIWESSLRDITAQYLIKQRAKETLPDDPPTLIGATATNAQRLIFPATNETQFPKQPLLVSYAQLNNIKPELVVHWCSDQRLVHIGISPNAHRRGSESHKIDKVQFPQDDWIAGFLFTTKEESCLKKKDQMVRSIIGLEVLFCHQQSVKLGSQDGDKRLVHVSEGHFAVGIMTTLFSEKQLSRLSILQQPYSNAVSARRVKTHHDSSINLDVADLLWRKALPPSPIQASSHRTGYWHHGFQVDIAPMEALVFGTTEEEMADITSVSADIRFGGFQVTYGSRPTRSIGPMLRALKTLKVAGKDGERIVKMTEVTGHIPGIISLTTNWGRQLVVGHMEGVETSWPPSGTLCGFYCSWERRNWSIVDLCAVGCLFSSNSSSELQPHNLPPPDVDTNGFRWIPCAPPSLLIEEFGQIWGEFEGQEPPLRRRPPRPGPMSQVSFLDCTRPIAELRSVICNVTSDQQLPLCGLSLRYSDTGEEATIGADQLVAPSIFPEHELYGCSGEPSEQRMRELKTKPHFTSRGYSFQSLLLKSLKIWLAEDGILRALQFTGDGVELPLWSASREPLGEPSGEIFFEGAGGGEAKGIKFFTNSSFREISREDSMVVCVQAVKAG